MAETLKQLRDLTDEQIIARHDQAAQSTQVGTQHYLQELARRDQDKQTRAMLKYTKYILWMTLIMTIFTIINVIVFIKNK